MGKRSYRFGGEPPGQNRDQPGRAHPQRQEEERPRRIEAVTLAQPQAPQTGENHQHAQADHDAKRPEHNGRVRPVLGREVLERRHLFVQRVGQDQVAQVGDFHRVLGFFGLCVF